MTDSQHGAIAGQSTNAQGPAEIDVSVVVPVYNEEESLPPLLEQLHAALGPTGLSYELVLIDDGSRDNSYAWLERTARRDPALTIIKFRRNFGQTAALQAGLDAARGAKIVTMDADLQNDPADIPAMLERIDEGFDLVAGWRADRQDPFLNRRLPSMIANRVISMATKVKLHDYGCTLKAMTRDVAKELRLYGEMHRFIPAVASWMGVSFVEVKVNHRARQFGVSKYGIGRTLRVILDLMTVRFMQSYLTRPMQVFGFAGLMSFFVGAFVCVSLAAEKLLLGEPLAGRPLLLAGVLLVVVGIQLLSLGLVADVVSRTYHESQGKRPYYIRLQHVGAGARGAAPAIAATPWYSGPPSSATSSIHSALGQAPREGVANEPAPADDPDAPRPGTITAPPGASFPPPSSTVPDPDLLKAIAPLAPGLKAAPLPQGLAYPAEAPTMPGASLAPPSTSAPPVAVPRATVTVVESRAATNNATATAARAPAAAPRPATTSGTKAAVPAAVPLAPDVPRPKVPPLSAPPPAPRRSAPPPPPPRRNS